MGSKQKDEHMKGALPDYSAMTGGVWKELFKGCLGGPGGSLDSGCATLTALEQLAPNPIYTSDSPDGSWLSNSSSLDAPEDSINSSDSMSLSLHGSTISLSLELSCTDLQEAQSKISEVLALFETWSN